MEKIISFLVSVTIAFFSQLSYIEPEEKPYSDDAYYSGTTQEDPDYRIILQSYNGASLTSKDKCSKTSKPALKGTKPFKPDNQNQFLWLWSIPTATYDSTTNGILDRKADFMQPYDKNSNKNGYREVDVGNGKYYMWKVPTNTTLVAFANGYLAAKEQHVESPYPETGYTKGVSISLIYKDYDSNTAYRVTYGSMERWWCCMSKTKADSYKDKDTKKPLFGHSETFSEKDTFYSGSVLGVAGKTGTADDTTTVLVKFASCSLENGQPNGNWSSMSLQEFYKK